MATLTDAINKVRLMANDTNTSHRAFPDSLGLYVNGSRTVFPLSNKNILPGAQYVQDNGALTAGTPTDAVNGIVTMGSAPTNMLEWYYYYLDFIDAEIQSMVDDGLAEVGMTESNLSTIDPTLLEVMGHFAAAKANQIRMTRFASQYNVSVEGQSYEKSETYKAYKAACDLNYTQGTEKRDQFYKRQGRQFVSASQKTTVNYPPDNQLPRR